LATSWTSSCPNDYGVGEGDGDIDEPPVPSGNVLGSIQAISVPSWAVVTGHSGGGSFIAASPPPPLEPDASICHELPSGQSRTAKPSDVVLVLLGLAPAQLIDPNSRYAFGVRKRMYRPSRAWIQQLLDAS
jgi:hypothetical protein